jgi:hypothetical protein
VAESLEQLVDLLYLPVEYPGQQRFLCYTDDEAHASRLVGALARELAKRVPSAQMGVHALWGLDWSSREALVTSLARKMEEAAPALAARIPRRANGSTQYLADQRLRLLMDPPDDIPERVQTFVMAVPGSALREDMKPCFFQLRALMSSSDHNWIIVAPLEITRFGEGVVEMSPFHTLFEPYAVRFSLADLPEAPC